MVLILPTLRTHDLESFLLSVKLKLEEYIVDSADADKSSPRINLAYFSWIRIDQFVLS